MSMSSGQGSVKDLLSTRCGLLRKPAKLQPHNNTSGESAYFKLDTEIRKKQGNIQPQYGSNLRFLVVRLRFGPTLTCGTLPTLNFI